MDSIYVYLLDDIKCLDERFVEYNLNKLPDFRREQCLKYRRTEDRKRCIAAYLLFRKGLRDQYGISSLPSFEYNKWGKPYLQGHSEIYFNISHCKSGVVCALSQIEIGVDIQHIMPFNQNLAARVCCNNELRRLSIANDPSKLFCKIWTQRESYAKAKGISIIDVLKRELPSQGFWKLNRKDYYLSLYHGKNKSEIFEIGVDCF